MTCQFMGFVPVSVTTHRLIMLGKSINDMSVLTTHRHGQTTLLPMDPTGWLNFPS